MTQGTSIFTAPGRDSYAKSAIVVLGPVAGRALACLMVGEALCGQALGQRWGNPADDFQRFQISVGTHRP